MAYASFGTPQLSATVTEFIDQCEWAGRQWAKAGNKKLPVHVTVGGRDVPVVRSRHEWAQAFVTGWKQAKAEKG